jgi:hypothetical protein
MLPGGSPPTGLLRCPPTSRAPPSSSAPSWGVGLRQRPAQGWREAGARGAAAAGVRFFNKKFQCSCFCWSASLFTSIPFLSVPRASTETTKSPPLDLSRQQRMRISFPSIGLQPIGLSCPPVQSSSPSLSHRASNIWRNGVHENNY